jgi:hypothetical protein
MARLDPERDCAWKSSYLLSFLPLVRKALPTLDAVVSDQREILGIHPEELLDLCFLPLSVRGVFSALIGCCWGEAKAGGGVLRGTEPPRWISSMAGLLSA